MSGARTQNGGGRTEPPRVALEFPSEWPQDPLVHYDSAAEILASTGGRVYISRVGDGALGTHECAEVQRWSAIGDIYGPGVYRCSFVDARCRYVTTCIVKISAGRPDAAGEHVTAIGAAGARDPWAVLERLAGELGALRQELGDLRSRPFVAGVASPATASAAEVLENAAREHARVDAALEGIARRRDRGEPDADEGEGDGEEEAAAAPDDGLPRAQNGDVDWSAMIGRHVDKIVTVVEARIAAKFGMQEAPNAPTPATETRSAAAVRTGSAAPAGVGGVVLEPSSNGGGGT